MSDLQFPIGKFQPPDSITEVQRKQWIDELVALPATIRNLVCNLSDDQLETPYRPGGWTVRQVVHHLPDSHANAYIRFRLALTEDSPLIKPYHEALWAELPDARTGPIQPSLDLLAGLHQRLVALLRTLSPADFARTFQHPERGLMTLERNLGLYAWHGRHHAAHITQALSAR